MMPVKLAEYGFGIFGMALIAWTIVQVVFRLVPAPSQKVQHCPAIDLAKLVEASTKATTESIQLVKNQTELVKRLIDLVEQEQQTLTEMRLEAARLGRAAS